MLLNQMSNVAYFPETLIKLLDKTLTISQLHQIHSLLLTSGWSHLPPFPSKLLSSFINSGYVTYSHRLLPHLPASSVVLYNKVIQAYSASKTPAYSIRVFIEMMRSGVTPDHFTFPFAVKGTARILSLRHGVSLHSHVLRCGHELDLFVCNSLIHMYAACGEIFCARKMFDEMPQRTRVSWNSLLDGYAKCGDLGLARAVFEAMPDKDVVSWSSIIDGHVKGGEYTEALAVFDRMKAAGKPESNEVTMVSVLCACSYLGALEQGRSMHRYIVENHLPLTLVLVTSLVDMYAKCGAIKEALVVFRGVPKGRSDVFLWNAIIGGLANHGYVHESLDMFLEMSAAGIGPDEITYLCVLSACAHGGLVKEAWIFFKALESNGITPKSEHYACMIDIMARAGQVGQAYDFLNRMPLETTPSMLGALLNGCMKHGRLDLAEILGKKLIQVDPGHDGRYIGLSNVYAAVRRWDDAKTMRQAMDITGVKKFPGYSYVEISGSLEMFRAHDKSHPKSSDIYGMVNFILTQIRRVLDYDDGETLI